MVANVRQEQRLKDAKLAKAIHESNMAIRPERALALHLLAAATHRKAKEQLMIESGELCCAG